MVHARRVGDRTLVFGVSGALWQDALVMFDRQTGSLWSHVTGECIEGEYEGERLAMVPVTLISFQEWAARHPETLVLAQPPGQGETSRYADYVASPRLGIFGRVAARDDLEPKAIVQGVAIGGEAAAVAHAALGEGEERVFELGGRMLAAVKRGGAVEIRAAGREGGEAPAAGDSAAGDARSWSASGEPVASTTAYWFAWLNFYPRSQVIE